MRVCVCGVETCIFVSVSVVETAEPMFRVGIVGALILFADPTPELGFEPLGHRKPCFVGDVTGSHVLLVTLSGFVFRDQIKAPRFCCSEIPHKIQIFRNATIGTPIFCTRYFFSKTNRNRQELQLVVLFPERMGEQGDVSVCVCVCV